MKSKIAVIAVSAALVAAPILASQSQRIPPGTRATLELQGLLTSKDAQPGDTFEATLTEAVEVEGREVVPAGAIFVGRVAEVERARSLSKGGELTLVIDRLIGGEGESAAAPGTVTGLAEGEDLKGDNDSGRRAGIGGAIGGALGAIVGGARGLIVGAVVGAGGAIAAGKGKDVELPEGTLLEVKFDQEVTVTWSWTPES